LGRLAVTRYPSGRIEGNAYDALGRMAAFTNAEGRVYRMSYDAQRRMLAATNAAGERVFRNLYDLVGNLTNRTDGAGRNSRFTYDALNRLTGTDYADGSWERFGYDAAGNLTAASNAASRLAFGFDAMNRLASSETRVAGQVFNVGYGYDLGGLVTNVTYPGGLRVRYAHDLDGRVTNVTDWANHAWTFTRDAAGRMTALACPNGVSGSWTHDANHKVSGWSYNNGSPLAGRTITRDDAGVKTKEQVTAGLFPNPQSPRRSANVFDAADRLTSATVAVGTNTVEETYLYDLNGALTNRQSAASDQQFEYDCAGRLTYSQQSTAYGLALTVDALGNRLTTYSANATHLWVTDHADPRKRPLMEADSNGVPLRYFIWGGGLLLAVVEADGTVRYAHSDDQGSVVALTDSNGAVTDQYCYGPYGTDWGHSGTNSIPFRWLGSHGVFNVGGSSLYLTRHRAYETRIGRFLSSDPIGLAGGANLYAYCLGSPLAYIDPLGLCAEATGDWVIGPADNPWLVFDRDIGHDLADGLFAGLDGLIPFADPFENHYDPFDNNLIVSRFLGSVSQVALTQAAGLSAVRAINSSLMPSTLYHFTSAEGAAGIQAVSGISAGSGVYGPGVYLTAFNNATMAGIQGAVQTEVAIPVVVEGLTVSATYFPGTYIVRGVSILLP
jgi:RHS repeat-associated protein